MKYYILTILITYTSMIYADATLEFKLNETGSIKRKIFLSAPYFRIDMENNKKYSIYDDNKKAMYIIDPGKKSYMKIDKNFVNKITEKMSSLRNKGNARVNEAKKKALEKIKDLPHDRQVIARQMIMGESIIPTTEQKSKMQQMAMQKIKKLPPEKQEMARQMMMKMFSKQQAKKKQPTQQARVKKKELIKTSITKIINGHKCHVYEKLVEGKLKSKLCISPPSQLGIKDKDFNLIKSMMHFNKEIRTSLMEKMPAFSMKNKFSQYEFIKGVPLEIIHINKKKKEVISDINLQTLQPNLFIIPEGFNEKRSFESMP